MIKDNSQSKDDYKKALDALSKRTARNWWQTGNCTKAKACTGSINLHAANKRQKQSYVRH